MATGNIIKYLFGKIKVELEADAPLPVPNGTGIEIYTLLEETGYSVEEITKPELEDGLLYQLDMFIGFWYTIPNDDNNLTELTWNKTQEETDFTLEYETSPLFDSFPGVLALDYCTIEVETDQEVLKDAEEIDESLNDQIIS